jgi:hypothetical protein
MARRPPRRLHRRRPEPGSMASSSYQPTATLAPPSIQVDEAIVRMDLAQFAVDSCTSFSPSQTALLHYKKGTGSLTTTHHQNIEDNQLSLTENHKFFPIHREPTLPCRSLPSHHLFPITMQVSILDKHRAFWFSQFSFFSPHPRWHRAAVTVQLLLH